MNVKKIWIVLNVIYIAYALLLSFDHVQLTIQWLATHVIERYNRWEHFLINISALLIPLIVVDIILYIPYKIATSIKGYYDKRNRF